MGKERRKMKNGQRQRVFAQNYNSGMLP